MTTLTDRQLEVARVLSQGYTYEEAAPILGIGPRTVKGHADAIRHKLGVAKMRHIAIRLDQESPGWRDGQAA